MDSNLRGISVDGVSIPSPDPIAIIGIGCRFPGGANDPTGFWSLLCGAIDAITEIPEDRWNIRKYFHPDPSAPGKTSSRWGGFLKDIDQFDPAFFRISAREAAIMDPQQRLLLEVAWEAIEDGGQVVEVRAGSNMGVFVGMSSTDYGHLQFATNDKTWVDVHTVTGTAMSIAANRISYCLNLTGPSFVVDTACSSALVAVHLACRSIQNRECAAALAGGVNLNLTVETFMGFSKAAMLAPDGRCKAFSAAADGYVRSEGAGMLLLKPLAAALAEGDPIYAVIRGSAINQDGATNGMTVPSARAQEMLIREACRDAGISPNEISYVEAHGTGTPVGDPIEAHALSAALCQERPAGEACPIGSVKTNIGHTEPAAGAAGLIKAALILKHRMIPPSLHFDQPSPHIDFEKLKLRVPTSLEPFGNDGGGRLFAGVNSFGFGGANAHVVLESPPVANPRSDAVESSVEPSGQVSRAELLPISAHTPEALRAMALNYAGFLAPDGAGAAHDLADICRTASLRRRHHAHRLTVVGGSHSELAARLNDVASSASGGDPTFGTRVAREKPKLAFVFGGQGPQWWAMGRELLDERHGETVFRQKVAECDRLFRSLAANGDRSLWEEMHVIEAESRMHRVATAHLAIFSVQVALAALWRSWGIEPDVVVGHSIGEIAAAHVVGALSLSDAAWIIFHRGLCLENLGVSGRMLAVGLPSEEATALVTRAGDGVWLAAINAPTSVTLSGSAQALEIIAKALDDRRVSNKFLKVDFPYHSGYLAPMQAEFCGALSGLEPRPATIPMVSTVTGEPVGGSELDAAYWWRNACEPVRFAAAMDALAGMETDLFVEIGSHPVLTGSIHDCSRRAARSPRVLASLRRGEPERTVMLGLLGALFTEGCPVRWRALHASDSRHVPLPAYAWQRERFWHEVPDSRESRLAKPLHPLLARNLDTAAPCWEMNLDMRLLTWLREHQVRGRVVFPAVGYVEMALAAAGEILGPGPCVLEEIDIQRPLFVPEGDAIPRVQLTYDAHDGSFRIVSRTAGSSQPWTLHCLGRMRPGKKDGANGSWQQAPPSEIWKSLDEDVPAVEFYERLFRNGLQLGPRFRGLQRIRRSGMRAIGTVQPAAGLDDELDDYRLHPAFLDSCLHIGLSLAPVGAAVGAPGSGDLHLPVRIGRVRFFGSPRGLVWAEGRLPHFDAFGSQGDIRVVDENGTSWFEVEAVECRPIRETRTDGGHSDCLYELAWQHKPLAARTSLPRPADFLPDAGALARRLQTESDRLAASLGWSESWQQMVDGLCVAYVVRAFKDLGLVPQAGERFDEDSMLRSLGVVPGRERLARRCLAMLEEEGVLRRDASGPRRAWEVMRPTDSIDIERRWRTLPFEHSELTPELILLERCGRHLPKVLRGEANPLDLLMPGGSMATLEHLYDSSRSFRLANTIAGKAVAAALERLPEGRTLRILEIGAGTGGLTAHLLPQLATGRAEYVFTDVSALFLSKAESRFAAYPFVQYRLLDIEMPPAEQGFAEHAFDLVVTSNTLHATADLRRTLAHAQQLLAPDGWLILLELSKPLRWLDLVFGLTEGWWKFADTDLRPAHPLLAPHQWKTLLAETHFKDVAWVSDPPDAAECEMAVLLARGPASNADLRSPQSDTDLVLHSEAPSWLVFADATGVASSLAQQFKARGERCVLISSEEAFRPALEAEPASFRGIVHLWSLDAPAEPSITALDEAEGRGCHSVMRAVQVLAEREQTIPLWLVTRGAQPAGDERRPLNVGQATLLGLGRVIINERPRLRCRMIDLDEGATAAEAGGALLEELVHGDGEEEVALRVEARYARRLVRTSTDRLHRHSAGRDISTTGGFGVDFSAAGSLGNLALRRRARQAPGPGEVEIEIRAAALNFRDVMKTLGLYETSDAAILGDECSGCVVAVGVGVTRFRPGDEVNASVLGQPGLGCLASHVTLPQAQVAAKPAHLSFEEAATVQIAFTTAHYALHQVARIRAGERILIHAAAGGVGLAAIHVARLAGAEIFATAGSPEKREFLRVLGVEHVMDSRALDFADEILEATRGQGVDVVLNSLSGQAIARGIACLREGGRFLEIGKRDLFAHTHVDLHPLRRNVSFCVIDVLGMARSCPEIVGPVKEAVRSQIEAGIYPALPHRTFPVTDIVGAMRHMSQARHIGKIVVSVPRAEEMRPTPEPLPADDRGVRFLSDAAYVITGGLSGLGLAVAEWMVENGARHLQLIGRRGATEETNSAVASMEKSGARIVLAQADVTSGKELARVLAELKTSMPPLRGVIHAAAVLDDGLLPQLDAGRFRTVTAPKVLGAWNLHELTRDTPLDFFVMFSSISATLGNPGQGNYAAGNAFLDALAYHRRALGLTALTISWGLVADIGYAARHGFAAGQFSRMGVDPLAPARALKILGDLLRTQATHVVAQLIQWKTLAAHMPSLTTSPTFAGLLEEDAPVPSAGTSGRLTQVEILAAPEGQRRHLVQAHLREAIARVVGMPVAKIAADRPFDELGMDSLMSVELSNGIEALLGLTVPSGTVMGSQNLAALASAVVELVEGSSQRQPAQAANTGALRPDGRTDAITSARGRATADADPLVPVRQLMPETGLDPGIDVAASLHAAEAPLADVFLTGATGFLGAYLLRELLDTTRARIHCLVRASDATAARSRLESALGSFGLWDPRFAERVIPVAGDLALPLLGLDADRFESLAAVVQTVFHSGADVNFLHAYPQLKTSNVLGTAEVLRLAGRAGAPFHHVSTFMVLGVPDPEGTSAPAEDVDLNAVGPIYGGYGQSKWVAEKLVQAAAARGIPCTVYRLGAVSGDSRHGSSNTDDLFCRFVKGFVQLGAMPDVSWELSLLPVDFASRAIVSLALQPGSSGKTYHLAHPRPVPTALLAVRLRARGHSIRSLPYGDWRRELESAIADGGDNALKPFRAMLPMPVGSVLPDSVQGFLKLRMDCSATAERLKSLSLACPALDDRLLDAYCAFMEQQGFLPQPPGLTAHTAAALR